MVIHFVLKGKYYDLIKSGQKCIEYRSNTPYWRKRIQGEHNVAVFHRGYTNITLVAQIRKIIFKPDIIEIHFWKIRF